MMVRLRNTRYELVHTLVCIVHITIICAMPIARVKDNSIPHI